MEHASLIDDAITATQGHYVDAVASEIAGEPDFDAWNRFRMATARVLLYFELLGRADVWSGTGLAVADAGPIAERRMAMFARDVATVDFAADDFEFIVGEFHEAVSAFRRKVPRLAVTIAEMATRALDLATEIAATERTDGVADLIKRSSALQTAIQHSFYVSGVDKRTVVQLKPLLAAVVRGVDAVSLPAVIDQAQAAGAASLTRARLETVIRTNVATAYGDGRQMQMADPAVRVLFPLMRFDSIRDRRTRGNPGGLYPSHGVHWQMDGYIATPADIARLGLNTPAGFNCRCSWIPVGIDAAIAAGWVDDGGRVDVDAIRRHNGVRQRYIARGEFPDPGFGSPGQPIRQTA